MERKKIKVAWVCSFSNQEVRQKQKRKLPLFENLLRYVLKKNVHFSIDDDFALWNTRGINEFKQINDIELHVISDASHLSTNIQNFDIDIIHYHFYKDDIDFLSNRIHSFLHKGRNYLHKKAHKRINHIIDIIHPDIIHIIGAENFYSPFILSRPRDIPVIVHLQTLLNEPGFLDKYPLMSSSTYHFKATLEREIFKRCDYIGTESESFKKIILERIDSSAKIFNMDLATALPIDTDYTTKEFDFVYFAYGIKKACDLVIKAFAIVAKSNPELKLDIIGSYSQSYKSELDIKLKEYGIIDNVTFEGSFPSHEDVIKQVKKSKFAILPFKVDYNPTTIPEAMSLGLPVVSTKTDGIKVLYKEEYNILLSDIGDHIGLANNMKRLLEDHVLADRIKKNAIFELQNDSNTARMKHWVEIYKQIIEENDKK